jgi:PBP1b-binding outer membrane lipoprotein LpoB
MKITILLVALIFVLSGCSKTPESHTAVDFGKQPKQVIDKVTADVNKAMQRGAEQRQDAEQRQEAEKKE